MKPKEIVVENKDEFFKVMGMLQEEMRKICDLSTEKYVTIKLVNCQTSNEYNIILDQRNDNYFTIKVERANAKPYIIKEIVLDKGDNK